MQVLEGNLGLTLGWWAQRRLGMQLLFCAGPRWQSLIGLGLVGAGASRHAAVVCAGRRGQFWIMVIFDWRWVGGRSCV